MIWFALILLIFPLALNLFSTHIVMKRIDPKDRNIVQFAISGIWIAGMGFEVFILILRGGF